MTPRTPDLEGNRHEAQAALRVLSNHYPGGTCPGCGHPGH